ncbi:MAG: hypothetical protein NVS2B16_33690 [Chloroflexota bacterium]
MHRIYTTLRERAIARIIRGTTFCEECSEVCPPACRREALRDTYRMQAQRAGLFHL